jgi:hypothetical protein
MKTATIKITYLVLSESLIKIKQITEYKSTIIDAVLDNKPSMKVQ